MQVTARVLTVLLCCSLESPAGKQRAWQTGEIDAIYRAPDLFTRSAPAEAGRRGGAGGMQTVRQFIEIRAGQRIYTIDRTIVPSSVYSTRGKGRRPEDFEEGATVKFVVEGKHLIVLGRDGKERKFRIRKEGVF